MVQHTCICSCAYCMRMASLLLCIHLVFQCSFLSLLVCSPPPPPPPPHATCHTTHTHTTQTRTTTNGQDTTQHTTQQHTTAHNRTQHNHNMRHAHAHHGNNTHTRASHAAHIAMLMHMSCRCDIQSCTCVIPCRHVLLGMWMCVVLMCCVCV